MIAAKTLVTSSPPFSSAAPPAITMGALSRLIRHPFSGRGRFQGFRLLQEGIEHDDSTIFLLFLLRTEVFCQTLLRGNLAMFRYFLAWFKPSSGESEGAGAGERGVRVSADEGDLYLLPSPPPPPTPRSSNRMKRGNTYGKGSGAISFYRRDLR